MSFLEKLPIHYKELKSKRFETKSAIDRLYGRLDTADNYCDDPCEHCAVGEAEFLTDRERADIEAEIAELEPVADEIDKTIKAVEGYAAFMKVELSK